MSAPEVCPHCGGDAGDNWFDRELCPCDDTMHTRCRNCGAALDGCPFDNGRSPTEEEVAYFRRLHTIGATGAAAAGRTGAPIQHLRLVN